MADYRDPNHIDPNGIFSITQLVKFIREKMFGIDVREAIAKGLEAMSEDVVSNENRQTDVETQFQAVMDAQSEIEPSGVEVGAARVDSDGVTHPNLKERLDTHDNEVIESREDINGSIYSSLSEKLNFWDNKTKDIEEDILSQHINVDWYVSNETENYTEIFDELIILAETNKTPIYLPEFKVYKADKDYHPKYFYGNGRLLNTTTESEIQISKKPDNIYQYSQGEITHKNTYGTFNNAVVQSLIANNPEYRPQIHGITTTNPEVLSTYNNRDNAVEFLAISTHSNFLEFSASEVTYTSDGVIISSLDESMDIPLGSILDTRHSPFYSGLVKSVDYVTKKITLFKGWYLTDGSQTLQTPTPDRGLTINRTTAVWVANWLIELKATDENTAAVVLEAGVINNQPKVENVTGIDMLLMGQYGGNCAFQARGRTATWLTGFYDRASDTSFLSRDATNGVRIINSRDNAITVTETDTALRVYGARTGYVSYTTIDGSPYYVRTTGVQNKIGYENEVVTVNETTLSMAHYVHLIRNGVTKVYLPLNVNTTGLMIEILSLSTANVTIEGYIFYDGSTKTGYSLAPSKNIRLYCDGAVWYLMGGN